VNSARKEALEDLAGRCDLDLDGDLGMIAAKTAKRVREEIDPGSRRGANVDRARVQARKRMNFLLACGQCRQGLACARGEHTPGLGEPAPTPVSLDQGLPRSRLEQTKVLARARLADPDCLGGSRDAPASLDFDEQAQASGIPQKGKRLIGHGDGRYR
jgi:hypothetical protein